MWNKYWVEFPSQTVANVQQVKVLLPHRAVAFSPHCVARRPKSCCSPPMMVVTVAGGLVTIFSISSITTLNGVDLL
jgi:hypothetical protein